MICRSCGTPATVPFVAADLCADCLPHSDPYYALRLGLTREVRIQTPRGHPGVRREPAMGALTCFRCRKPMPEPTDADHRDAVTIAGDTLRLPDGRLLVGANMSRINIYCAECSPGVVVCRACGCTAEYPCCANCGQVGASGLCLFCDPEDPADRQLLAPC